MRITKQCSLRACTLAVCILLSSPTIQAADLYVNAEFGNPVEVSRGSVVITANEGRFRSQMLMTPELLVASGEEQEIFSGNNIPGLWIKKTAR